jgi:hypothetical protein
VTGTEALNGIAAAFVRDLNVIPRIGIFGTAESQIADRRFGIRDPEKFKASVFGDAGDPAIGCFDHICHFWVNLILAAFICLLLSTIEQEVSNDEQICTKASKNAYCRTFRQTFIV